MRQRIGYLHVPKAAGTSVTDAIRRAVIADAERVGRGTSICPQVMDGTLYGSFDRYAELGAKPRSMILDDPGEQLAGYDVVVGHFAASSLRQGRSDDDIAIVLREPRARLMSHISYWSSWSPADHAAWDPYDGSRRAAAAWPDVLVDEALASQIDNVAARLLLSPHPLVPADRFIADHHVGEVTADALAALARIGFADGVENAPACWSRLGVWAGLDLEIGHRNVTDDSDADPAHWVAATTPGAMRALAARTVVDRALWLAAMQRNDPQRPDDEIVAIGDAAATGQLRKLSGGRAPLDTSWAEATCRTPAPSPFSVRGARRTIGRAWRRVPRRRRPH